MKLYVWISILFFTTPAFGILYVKDEASSWGPKMLSVTGTMPRNALFSTNISTPPLNSFPSEQLYDLRIITFFGNGEKHIAGAANVANLEEWPAGLYAAMMYYSDMALDRGIPIPTSTSASAIGDVTVYMCWIHRMIDGSPSNRASCIKTDTQSGGIIVDRPEQKPLSCSFSGDLQIRHYELTPERAINDKAYGTTYATCNRSAKVSVTIDKSVKLNGVEGLYSQLSVGGAAAGSAYTVNVGTGYTPLRVESMLKTQGAVTSGAFSGGAKMLITFP